MAGDEGGEYQDEKTMLDVRLDYDSLSRDAIDLSFAPVEAAGKSGYGAVLSANGEEITGGANEVLLDYTRITDIRITVGDLEHTLNLKDGAKLEHYLFTLCVNLPDLPYEAAAELFSAFEATQKAASNPDPFTVIKTYNRNALYNFVAGQTSFDRNIGYDGELVLGRVTKPRVVMMQSGLNADGTITSWIDLMQPFNEIHFGDTESRQGYSFASGLYMSELESQVLTGSVKTGYLDLWEKAPQGNEILIIPVYSGYRDEVHAQMSGEGVYPQALLDVVEANEKIIFTQTKATTVAGSEYFAWLEIDPVTYEAISVFSNGYHASMAETVIMNALNKMTDGAKGAWVGLNVSLWTTSSYSLKLDNHAAILANAKALALRIGKMLDAAQSLPGSAAGLPGGLSDAFSNAPAKLIDIGADQFMDEFISFSKGYEKAVNMYFDKAGKSSGK
jgi:hypothetical protein